MSVFEISNVVRRLLASHGLVLDTNTSDAVTAIDRAQRWIRNTVEIQIAGAAPPLTHPDRPMESLARVCSR